MKIKTTPTQNAPSVLFKMEVAINAHDIDAFVNCFANDFVSEQPVHPERNFVGELFTHTIAMIWVGRSGTGKETALTAQNSICEALLLWD